MDTLQYFQALVVNSRIFGVVILEKWRMEVEINDYRMLVNLPTQVGCGRWWENDLNWPQL